MGRAYRRILWSTDFSPLAKAALPHAVKWAEDHGAELVVLHVLTPAVTYALPQAGGALWERIGEEARVAARPELRRITGHIKALAPQLRIHRILTDGVPFEQIVRVAERLQCDLIVLATHGRTGFSHVFLGSVAENVVRRATCPVLTVRPHAVAPPG